MASSHKTEHYGLSQFAPLDRPAWLVDYNTDMEKIDKELWNISQEGGGGGTLDQVARDMAQAAQDAAKDAQGMATAAQATADEALEKAEEALNQQGTISGDITNINEEITQIKANVNTAQSTATTANQTAEEALTLAQGCVKRSGDTMTGVLKLAGDPVDDADAANKGYVDSVAGNPFPDNPFTDEQWKFGLNITGSYQKFTFPRLPKQILITANNLTTSNDALNIDTYGTDTSSFAEWVLGKGYVRNLSAGFLLNTVQHETVGSASKNKLHLVNYNWLTMEMDVDNSVSFRVENITSGTVSLYWR